MTMEKSSIVNFYLSEILYGGKELQIILEENTAK